MKKTLIEKLKSKYTQESQIKTRVLGTGKNQITIFYIESLVDKVLFSSAVLSPLQKFLKDVDKKHTKSNFETIKTGILSLFSIEETKDVNSMLKDILCGFVVLIVNIFIVPFYSIAIHSNKAMIYLSPDVRRHRRVVSCIP